MKKILSLIVVVVMMAAMIATNAFAEDVEYISPGNIIVPYIAEGGITIDGVLEQGEWSETNKIQLNETNLVEWTPGGYYGPIDFYYSWTDKGLYMAAVVSDADLSKSGAMAAKNGAPNGTRFQIAFNPANIISDDYMGLFFSFCPVKDVKEEYNNVVDCMRHNWELSDNGMVLVEYDDPTQPGECGYQGKYTYRYDEDGETIIGWNMEVLLPWEFIATEDRYADINDDYEDEILLTNFSPKDADRSRAYLTATIAYVQMPDTNTGRTCTDGIVTWEVDSYDIVLFFAQEGELTRDTETGFFTLGASATDEPHEDTQAPTETEAKDTKAPETNAPEPAVNTQAPDNNKDTKAPETKAAVTVDNEKGSFPWVIVIIIAVVVVAAVVVGIILAGKKKKA